MACIHSAPKYVIDALLEAAPDIAVMQDKSRNVPLHYACWHGSTDEVISKLLLAAPKAAKKMSSVGNLPLHCAIIGQGITPEALEVLVQSFPKALTVQNSNLQTPLKILKKSPNFAYKQRYLNILQNNHALGVPVPVETDVYVAAPISEPTLRSREVSSSAALDGVPGAFAIMPAVAQMTANDNDNERRVDVGMYNLEADRVEAERRMLDEFKRRKEEEELLAAAAVSSQAEEKQEEAYLLDMPNPPNFSPQSMDEIGQEQESNNQFCSA